MCTNFPSFLNRRLKKKWLFPSLLLHIHVKWTIWKSSYKSIYKRLRFSFGNNCLMPSKHEYVYDVFKLIFLFYSLACGEQRLVLILTKDIGHLIFSCILLFETNYCSSVIWYRSYAYILVTNKILLCSHNGGIIQTIIK